MFVSDNKNNGTYLYGQYSFLKHCLNAILSVGVFKYAVLNAHSSVVKNCIDLQMSCMVKIIPIAICILCEN